MENPPKLSEDEFLVPAEAAEAEIKVKGSKFIAHIVPALSKEDAEEAYLYFKKKYYNATHNCLAYRINENVFRYSDDGEPSGTAGKPILQALDGKHLQEVLCVVTRYFGGTKLGTGGLIRAYSEATIEAIQNLAVKIKVKSKQYSVNFPYELEPNIRRLLTAMNGQLKESKYDARVQFILTVPLSHSKRFEQQLSELHYQAVQFSLVG